MEVFDAAVAAAVASPSIALFVALRDLLAAASLIILWSTIGLFRWPSVHVIGGQRSGGWNSGGTISIFGWVHLFCCIGSSYSRHL